MFQGSVGYTLRYSMNIFINNSFLRVAQTNKLIKKKHYIISFKQKNHSTKSHPPPKKQICLLNYVILLAQTMAGCRWESVDISPL